MRGSFFVITLFSLTCHTPQLFAHDSDDTCLRHRDCNEGFECIGAEGTCTLPNDWNGPREIRCTKRRQCKRRVDRDSRCDFYKAGTCERYHDGCLFEDELVDSCPRGYECDRYGICKDQREDEDECSVTSPCKRGLVCCSDGSCEESCSCSRFNPEGTCPLGKACTRKGRCRNIRCSYSSQCPDSFMCLDEICVEEEQEEVITFPGHCSKSNPYGFCEPGRECRNGKCKDASNDDIDDGPCSYTKPNGWCEPGRICEQGRCVDDEDDNPRPCSKYDPEGFCGHGRVCKHGQCLREEVCTSSNWDGFCPFGEICRNGVCVAKNQKCSRNNLNGFCPHGEYCNRRGKCVEKQPLESYCSSFNPCPKGQICDDGECQVVCSTFFTDGFCPEGQTCQDGQCEEEEDPECSYRNPDGDCPSGMTCKYGRCEDEDERRCSYENPRGECPYGKTCQNGKCKVKNYVCSLQNPQGKCPHGLICADGRGCHYKCSKTYPDGFCPDDRECVDGDCQVRSTCKPACGDGKVCKHHVCVDEDDDDDEEEKRCYHKFDCPLGKKCKKGKCVKKGFLGHDEGQIHIPGIGVLQLG